MLEGDLGDFTLPDILKLLAFTGKTGRLGIVSDHARGRIDLVQGRLRDASADADHLPLARRLLGRRLLDGTTVEALLGDADALPTDLELAQQLVARDAETADAVAEVLHEQALDAVFDLLRWSEGRFRFETGAAREPDDHPPVLNLTIDEALKEGERRLEAWSTIHERTGPGDAVVNVGRPAEPSVQVDADGWQLLGLADGRRTIDELSVLCGRGQFDTRCTLAALLELGVVTISRDGSSGGADGLVADQALLSRLEASLGGITVPQRASVDATDGQRPTATTRDAEVHDLAAAPDPDRAGELIGSGARRGARNGRLTQDPSVDADLVSRLISGVEGL